MATAVIMPRQGQSVESCIISKWHKQKNDNIAEGDLLFTYETDKATFDETAKQSGKMLDIFFEEGDDVTCLTNVCVIGNEGEDTGIFDPRKAEASAASVSTAAIAAEPAETPAAVAQAVVQTVDGEFIRVSPRARNYAERHHVDYRVAQGTGAMGRIMERDVEQLIQDGRAVYTPAASAQMNGQTAAGSAIGGRVGTTDMSAGSASAPITAAPAAKPADAAPDYEDIALPNVRKVIARSMHKSLSEMAQLTLNSSFDSAEIMEFRAKVKASGEAMGLENITLNDIVLFAVSRTLLGHKDLNAHFLGDTMTMRYFKHVHLCVAVDTPRGLLVPKIPNADTLSLNELSSKAKQAAKGAQSGSIDPDLLTGGTFTVTNLGSMGVESFTPVINPPQTAILGVGNITQRVRAGKNGEIEMYGAMGLSLTFDHRAVDGAPAARFLKELCYNLEHFTMLLVK